MIFKCGPNELTYSFSIILADLEYIKIEIKIHNIQIIANDPNGFSNVFSQSLSFSSSLVRYYGLI